MNIELEYNNLEKLIEKLEKDNLNIYNIVKDMHLSFKTLDEEKWHSSEKIKLDSKLISMMNNLDENLLLYLNNCTDTLKLALNSYQKSDSNLKNNVEKF